ncbi:hypothetical protein Tdes44962_MAKER07430 [Teratosphaeria destructans]|uniref:Uncharacterized protein n=1 Tax=Teratosphaeria destructans TaxID=418781 RepID=A0A9W7SYU4_9PEZI|nr:hypothetical protein Tdes44962_MAKER07430 [Teratosphaeria destructans]
MSLIVPGLLRPFESDGTRLWAVSGLKSAGQQGPTMSSPLAVTYAMMLNNLPQKLATPHAVPRIGAANTSGVQPYSTR